MAIEGSTGASGVDRMLGQTKTYDAVFTDKKDNGTIKASDFLSLMIAQMRNQDFLNPMDDTQFVTQMAQFSTMQQMTELAEYSKSNYATSLVGKTVTAARFNASGNLDTTTGVVNKISLVDNEYVLYIAAQPEDKRYTLAQVMEISASIPAAVSTEDTDAKDGAASGTKVDPSGIRLEAGESTSNAAVVFWNAPTSDAAVASQLRYSVYYSTEGPFDTLDSVKAGTLSGQAEQKNILASTVPGLEPGAQYYINVVVKDAEGVERVYKPTVVTTRANETATGAVNPPAEDLPAEETDAEDGTPALEAEAPEVGDATETEETADQAPQREEPPEAQ